MSNKLKSRNKSYQTNHLQDYINFIPVLLVILLVPLTVRGIQVDTYLSKYIWYSKATKIFDVFLYSKSIVFIACCTLMVVCILINTCNKSINWKHYIQENRLYLAPLGIYSLLTIISTIFSKHTKIALRGMVEQFESIWVLLGYALIVCYIVAFLKSKEQVHMLLTVMNSMILVVTLIGLSQLLKHDFFQTAFGRSFISKNQLSFRFSEGHVYATLYNPNYVGVFAALLTPILVIQLIYSKTKLKKLIYSLLTIGLLACAYGSKSSSGIIGIIAGIIALLLLLLAATYRQYIKKHIRTIVICLCAILITVIGGIVMIGNNSINNSINNSSHHNLPSKLTSIQTMDDYVSITYNNEELKISFAIQNNEYYFKFMDANNKEILYDITSDGQFITVKEEAFQDLRFYVLNYDNTIVFGMDVENSSWYFTNQTDGTYYYCNRYGKLLKLNQTADYKEYWSFGTGRGYIWDRTLPILKEHWLIGTGPDTYAMYFPNTDYLDLFHANFREEVITKPHSLYLQIATQTGVPSLIAFIVFYIIYLVNCIKLYLRKSIATYEVQIGIAVLAGTFGYMVACLTNDSTITVAPLFWALIGIGIGLNHLIKKTS